MIQSGAVVLCKGSKRNPQWCQTIDNRFGKGGSSHQRFGPSCCCWREMRPGAAVPGRCACHGRRARILARPAEPGCSGSRQQSTWPGPRVAWNCSPTGLHSISLRWPPKPPHRLPPRAATGCRFARSTARKRQTITLASSATIPLRRRLLDPVRDYVLNRRDPLGQGTDFADLDAMADALWGASER